MTGTHARYDAAQLPGEADQYGLLLASGFATIPSRDVATQQGLIASQALNLTYFRSPQSKNSTAVKAYTGSTAAGTPTLIRMGIYSVAANGDLALVASTPNDTTLFASTNTGYSKSWSVSFNFVKGVWYAFGVLVVATTVPTLFGVGGVNGLVISQTAQKTNGSVLAQADLPSSVAAGSVGASTSSRIYAELT